MQFTIHLLLKFISDSIRVIGHLKKPFITTIVNLIFHISTHQCDSQCLFPPYIPTGESKFRRFASPSFSEVIFFSQTLFHVCNPDSCDWFSTMWISLFINCFVVSVWFENQEWIGLCCFISQSSSSVFYRLFCQSVLFEWSVSFYSF